VQLYRQRTPNASQGQEWLKRVFEFAEELEVTLYRSAPTFEAYIDITTLQQRLQQIAISQQKQCELEEKLQTMSTDDNGDVLVTSSTICANCGKDGANNACAKCKQVKYCNAVCKRVHKKKHKIDCEAYQRRAAKLRDEKLFKQPVPRDEDDCPLCYLRIPTLPSGSKYKPCCGKRICCGCIYAVQKTCDKQLCPYCRIGAPKSNEELMKSVMKRVEANDPVALMKHGTSYSERMYGFPRDYGKALELWHRAGELGDAEAYGSIGDAYENGRGVEVDEKKATYYYELAAMKGCTQSRYNLAIEEENAGNMDRALKHLMIAVRSGSSDSLNNIKELYEDGAETKEVYMRALQSYQEYLGEIISPQRDKAAAEYEEDKYY